MSAIRGRRKPPGPVGLPIDRFAIPYTAVTWFLSLLNGAISAVTSAVLAGFVASLAADWYSVPSREGAAGFFVLGFIVLGLLAGFALGVATSRIVAGRPDPGFLKALGLSQLALLSIILVIGGAARLLADVGPTVGGKSLLLNIELRWPAGAELPPDTSNGWFLRLGSASGGVMRTSEVGPLWREDARLEDGRWIVPGAVNLFTSRGRRLIMVEPAGVVPTGFDVPVPAWPGRGTFEWSAWLPRLREGAPPVPGGVSYRWRLVPEDQPVRVQRFGPFEIGTLASSVGEVTYAGHPRTWTATADFTIRYRGQPVAIHGTSPSDSSTVSYARVQAVALLPGADTALLVLANGSRGAGDLWLIAPEGDRVRTEPLAAGVAWNAVPPLTNDSGLFHRSAARQPVEGRVDLTGFAAPGLYLLPGAVFDTRTRSMQPFAAESLYNIIDRIPPLGLSPDERSFVRLGYQPDTTEAYVAEVIDRTSGERYRLPLDRYRMRFGEIDDIDPVLLQRFFEWKPGKDGADRLVPRAHPDPPPFRGVMSSDDPGYREYRVHLATSGLRAAMVDWLVREFQGERLPTDSTAYAEEVRVDGQTVYLSWDPSDRHVGVWVDSATDTRIVTTIAERWNAALATGRYDHLFVTGPDAAE